MNSNEFFEVFSDASSFNNGYKDPNKPMFASCGVVITYNQKILKKGSKFFDDKTISYGELKGSLLVLDLLQKRILDNKKYNIEPPYNVKLYSDSQFVIKSINEWMTKWLKNCKDWKTDVWYNSSGSVVGQYELFREMKLKYLDNSDWNIEFIHVKGHTGKNDFISKMNDMCDHLATDITKAKIKELGLK